MLHLFVSHKNVPFRVNIDCDLVVSLKVVHGGRGRLAGDGRQHCNHEDKLTLNRTSV